MLKMSVGKVCGYFGAVGALILALAGLTGCQTGGDSDAYAQLPGYTNYTMEASAAELPTEEKGAKADTIIRVGDTLLVNFTDTPAPIAPMERRVEDDGTIKVYYNEQFNAAGSTISQLEKEVHDRYVPKFFTRLTVSISQKENRFYVVGGEVRQPGQRPYVGRITVTQAIESSGGLTDFAKKRDIQLIHPNHQIEHINYKKAIKDPRFDRPVYPNDQIHVSRSMF
jgi:protein involved in polysaccharide export with SLBB domain